MIDISLQTYDISNQFIIETVNCSFILRIWFPILKSFFVNVLCNFMQIIIQRCLPILTPSGVQVKQESSNTYILSSRQGYHTRQDRQDISVHLQQATPYRVTLVTHHLSSCYTCNRLPLCLVHQQQLFLVTLVTACNIQQQSRYTLVTLYPREQYFYVTACNKSPLVTGQ